MKSLVIAILAALSSAASAAPSPSEQLATGKGYYYGTDREQHSGFACFWLKSAEAAGADASAFAKPACDDAERKGYSPDHLEKLVGEYQKTGKAPAENQLVEEYMQPYDGMPKGEKRVVADSPAPRFDATNTTYRESDAYSRVPIEVQIEQAERLAQQQAQQQAAQQNYQAQQMEQMIMLQQQQIRMQQEQLSAQTAAAEEAQRQERKRRNLENFQRQQEMLRIQQEANRPRNCDGKIDEFGRVSAYCY